MANLQNKQACNKLSKLLGIISIAMLFTVVAGETRELGEGELVTNLWLDAKEYAHFVMKVTKKHYNAKKAPHLSISAFATSYDSDPDIYISKVSQTLP